MQDCPERVFVVTCAKLSNKAKVDNACGWKISFTTLRPDDLFTNKKEMISRATQKDKKDSSPTATKLPPLKKRKEIEVSYNEKLFSLKKKNQERNKKKLRESLPYN